jgi:DNA anti-recombination protein RmuC
MYKMRDGWTDERMDDFRDEVNRRFGDVDRRFDEVDKRFDRVDKRFDKVDHEFGRLNDRFDALERLLLRMAGATIVTLIAGAAGIISQL